MNNVDVEKFIASSEFRKLPKGYQCAIQKAQETVNQVRSGAQRHPAASTLVQAAKATVFELVLRAPALLPVPEPTCACPVHGEVKA